MPELPEAEVVRLGLAEHVVGRTIVAAEVRHPRAVRRQLGGEADFVSQLAGASIISARRRGKYLWLELSNDRALLAHLGMSGQLRIQPPGVADEAHLRVRLRFKDGGTELRFVDQRTFGGLAVTDLVERDGGLLPEPVAHIARDPLDPAFDLDTVVTTLRRKRTELKRALLDQTVVSGIGNIYADEALWLAGLHGARPTAALSRHAARAVLHAASEVMRAALAAGGTSFDVLYVNINGQSGYFDRSLRVYGQAGRPCARCATVIQRVAFTNRSSYFCPSCQRPPRRRRG